MKKLFSLLLVILFLLCGCATRVTPPTGPPVPGRKTPGTQRPYRINGRKYYPLPTAQGFEERGIASWYGRQFHGRKTSNGETYDMYAETAAHKTLPMNTRVLVKNLDNNREMVVRINDRGPFVRGRVIDLSYTAAKKLGVVAKGTARVKLTALGEAVTYRKNNKKVERFLPHPDFKTGDFYIQIGSFTLLDNARRLCRKIRGQGKNCLIRKYDRGDMIFYRVQVHGGNTLRGAGKLEKYFEKSGYPDSFVVAK